MGSCADHAEGDNPDLNGDGYAPLCQKGEVTGPPPMLPGSCVYDEPVWQGTPPGSLPDRRRESTGALANLLADGSCPFPVIPSTINPGRGPDQGGSRRRTAPRRPIVCRKRCRYGQNDHTFASSMSRVIGSVVM